MAASHRLRLRFQAGDGVVGGSSGRGRVSGGMTSLDRPRRHSSNKTVLVGQELLRSTLKSRAD